MLVVVVAFFGSLMDGIRATSRYYQVTGAPADQRRVMFLSTRPALGEVKSEMWEMEANDYWTFVGLVSGAFVIVVAPRLFQPGHLVNSVIYLTGGTVVIVAASIARWRTRRKETEAAESTAHDLRSQRAVR
jgi:hypothetical protein